MKRILINALLAISLFSCNKELKRPVGTVVLLDVENTYKAGKPVKFIFSEHKKVDNIVFYSGEAWNKYWEDESLAADIQKAEEELKANPKKKIPVNKGFVVSEFKNFPRKSFLYTYKKPGTYKVYFVLTNGNYLTTNKKIQHYSITIVP